MVDETGVSSMRIWNILDWERFVFQTLATKLFVRMRDPDSKAFYAMGTLLVAQVGAIAFPILSALGRRMTLTSGHLILITIVFTGITLFRFGKNRGKRPVRFEIADRYSPKWSWISVAYILFWMLMFWVGTMLPRD
jgi:hypothetical protein